MIGFCIMLELLRDDIIRFQRGADRVPVYRFNHFRHMLLEKDRLRLQSLILLT